MLNNLVGIYGVSAPVSTNSYESIATANGTGSSNTITFSSIPSTYKHLQVRIYSLATGTPDWISLKINADTTTTNYRMHHIYGDGTSAVAQSIQGGSYTPIQFMLGGSTTQPAVAVADFLDYSNTNKNSVVRTLQGWDTNGDGKIAFESILWMNTATISELEFRIYSSNFATATKFALYGIKG